MVMPLANGGISGADHCCTIIYRWAWLPQPRYLVARLRQSPLGYRWLAVREDPQAAQAVGIDVFRARMLAMLISSSMTAVGGVFYGFYYRNLFPSQVFDIGRSIELILAPIIGGFGTIFGPIVGAIILTPLERA